MICKKCTPTEDRPCRVFVCLPACLPACCLQLLVFCKIDAYGNPTVPGLLSLAGQMKMGRGLLMAVGLLEGDMVEVSNPPPLSPLCLPSCLRSPTTHGADCMCALLLWYCWWSNERTVLPAGVGVGRLRRAER